MKAILGEILLRYRLKRAAGSFSKMHVQQYSPRSPFTKGEDDLFGRDMVSCGAPLLERGDGGISFRGKAFILQRPSICGSPPMGAQSVGLSRTAKPPALPVDYLLLLDGAIFFKTIFP